MKYNIKTKKLPKSIVEMEISFPSVLLDEYKKKALTNLSSSAQIDGFRKGHIPENILTSRLGENYIIEEAADILIKEHFPKIIEEEKLAILGKPTISITKIASGNDLELKASFIVLPDFSLPDYKSIAKKSKLSVKNDKEEANTEEIDKVLEQMRKNKAHIDWHKQNPESKDHTHNNIDLEKEENLPKLDDDFAKSAGNFNTLEELKNKIKENIINEKINRNIEKKRALIMDNLIKETKIDTPDILIENEIEKSLMQIKGDIERIGGKWQEYLEHIKKNEDDLRSDLRENSEKKAKIQLIFNKIAEEEKIEPDKEILENEIKNIMSHYKDASEDSARIYVSTILKNSLVLKLLDNTD